MKRWLRFLISRILWYSRIADLLPLVISIGPHLRIRFRSSAVPASMFVERDFFADDLGVVAELLEPGDVFVDVGANVGVLSIGGASAVGPAGRVIAVEPHPRICGFLRENLELNRLRNVDVHCCGLGSEAGSMHLSTGKSDDQNHISSAPTRMLVEIKTLDEIVPAGHVKLLKLDVEGYELSVLAGGSDALSRTEWIYFECAPALLARYGTNPDELFELLDGKGFDLRDPLNREHLRRFEVPIDTNTNFLAHNRKYDAEQCEP